MSIDRLKEINTEIERLLKNIRSNPNRLFSSNYLLDKTVKLKQLKEEAYTTFKILDKNPTDQIIEITANFNRLYLELNKILEVKSIEILDTENQIKMANFDLANAIKIIPEFSGKPETLSNFINLVELFHDTLSIQSQPLLISFVVKTRLAETVRNKLTTLPKTLVELKNALNNINKGKKSAANLLKQLTNCKQLNLSLQSYIENVEKLTADLNMLQISEQGADHEAIIRKLNDQIALNAFKTGINEVYKSTIIASKPKTLADATSVATEIEQPQSEQKVFFMNKKFNKNNHSKKKKYFSSQNNDYNARGNKEHKPFHGNKSNNWKNSSHIQGKNKYNNKSGNGKVHFTTSGNGETPTSAVGISEN